MSYTLTSGVTTGSVDPDSADGTYRIRDGCVDVDAYETARALVAEIRHLQWADGDPGSDESEAAEDADDSDDGADSESGDGLEDMAYRDLQDLAQEHDIKANQSTEDLIAALREA